MRERETLLAWLQATTSCIVTHLALSNEISSSISQEAIALSSLLKNNQDDLPEGLTSLVEGLMQTSQDYVRLRHDFKEYRQVVEIREKWRQDQLAPKARSIFQKGFEGAV